MTHKRPFQARRRYLILLTLLAVALYIVIPQLSSFRSGLHLLGEARLAWVAAALGMTFLTYFAAAGTYYFLAFKPLRYRQLVLIEMTAMFVNRLLPAGIGALGTNYAYLRKRQHSPVQAATVVAANNLIGVTAHLIITAAMLAYYGPGRFKQVWQQWDSHGFTLPAAVAILLALVLFVLRHKIASALASLKQPVHTYLTMPHKLAGALITSVSLTLCNLLCLEASALSLGVHISPITILIVFSFGLGAATATPTPGGLGGFEAGLFAGLVAFHLSASTALALVLLYRLVSFWAPLLVGGLALAVSQKKKLFSGYI